MRVLLPGGDGGTEEGGLKAGRMTCMLRLPVSQLCLTDDCEAAAAADGAAGAPGDLPLPPVNAVAAHAASAAAVILAGRSVCDLTACRLGDLGTLPLT